MDAPPPRLSPTTDASAQRRAAEAQWLQQIAARGTAAGTAWRALHGSYAPKIVSFCMRRGLSHAEAEDLAQEVFVTLYEKAADFDAAGNPSAWIWAIARHRWIDVLRHPYRARRADGDGEVGDDGLPTEVHALGDAPPDAAPQAADACVQRGLQAFGRVNPEAAMVIELRDLEGWTIDDVAQHLGRTEGATRTFLSEVRKKLRPFLEPCLDLLPN